MQSNSNVNNFVVTNVSIRLKDTNSIKAICSILLNDMFVVHDIRIVENRRGNLLICMPSKKMADGRFKDVCNPINREARKIIEDAVLEEYCKATTLSDETQEILL